MNKKEQIKQTKNIAIFVAIAVMVLAAISFYTIDLSETFGSILAVVFIASAILAVYCAVIDKYCSDRFWKLKLSVILSCMIIGMGISEMFDSHDFTKEAVLTVLTDALVIFIISYPILYIAERFYNYIKKVRQAAKNTCI